MILRPGRYASLSALGLNDRISSVRAVSASARYDDALCAGPAPVYDNHRRRDEKLYEANVTSVRAILGPPEQRCWTEREQVTPERSGVNVPGCGRRRPDRGVLGHQVAAAAAMMSRPPAALSPVA